MLKTLLCYIGLGGPEHDARILAKDARAMIEMVHGQHSEPSLALIADKARTQIGEVHRRGINDVQFYGRGVDDLTELNRAARKRRDNIAWSGITLTIIYIQAEIVGEVALPARNVIDGFIDKYAPPPTDEDIPPDFGKP